MHCKITIGAPPPRYSINQPLNKRLPAIRQKKDEILLEDLADHVLHRVKC